jgi:hypothetical protein
MTNVEQAFLLCGGAFLLSFFAIWAFWFVERLRGDSAPKATVSGPLLQTCASPAHTIVTASLRSNRSGS